MELPAGEWHHPDVSVGRGQLATTTGITSAKIHTGAAAGSYLEDSFSCGAKLDVIAGASPTSILIRLPSVIGRSRKAKIKLPASTVSRRHCEIYEYEGQIAVRDLGSSNGTVVNGHKIEGPTFLAPDDDLRVGPATMRVTTASASVLLDARSPQAESASVPSSNEKPSVQVEEQSSAGEQAYTREQKCLPASDSSAIRNRDKSVKPPDDEASFLSYAENDEGSFVDVVSSSEVQSDGENEAVPEDRPVFEIPESPKSLRVRADDSELKDFLGGLE